MTTGREPEGSTANLPEMQDIEAAEATTAADIDEMFGMSADGDDDDKSASPADGTGASPGTPAAGEGAGGDEGSSSAPEDKGGKPASTPAEGAAPGQPAGQPDGTPSAPAVQQGQPTPTPLPAAAPGQPAPVDPNALKVQSLETTVAALQAELARARANPQGQGQAQPGQPAPGGGSGQADDLPRYALNLPQQVAAALTSGDDQQVIAGITHMMNSLATIVHHNARLEMRGLIGNLMSSAREQDTQTETAKAIETAREDYYKAFPAHKDPMILPLIQSETVAMASEFPGLQWSDQYRNALGARVEAKLALLRGGGQQPAGNGQQPASQPAASLPGGTRAEQTFGGELTGGDLIADTFS